MADQEARPGGRATGLLIADSDALVRHGLAEYLRDCGYRVVEAASYEEAIEVLGGNDRATGHSAAIEIVLSDVELKGGGSGFGLRAWLRANRPEVGVVLAGNVESAAKAASELCDEGPHLSRPYEPQMVADRIRRMLADQPAGGNAA